MIDINAVLSQALKAAVDEAVKPLIERITQLEADRKNYDETLQSYYDRIYSLENNRPSESVALDERQITQALNSQEWFWDKINRYVDGQIEEAIDEHCTNYDHDQYDEVYNEWGCESTAEFAREENIEEKISEKITKAVRELDITVSIR